MRAGHVSSTPLKSAENELDSTKTHQDLCDYSLFWDGVWMSYMGSQTREATRIRFGPASVPAPAPPIFMDDVCVYQGFARLNL